ncbi:uncharacterized protein FFB20_08867 [Fusarium fujikuroi]|uniref:Uncharacterized protein n=1 Tax=Fusarium fujikuroi TaxID=5127 RepID=A0A5Q3FMM1_FUSFU|nr:hypothetical protein CEK25_005600 [Fusarium fujikuroi]QGI92582.1 hypothetical protein CEK26_005651 [Fusarium fujikuroi]SCN91065.1 uncharacterized protein FFB20_08867 [Fusarium fujikuroi]VTT75763.1 unnamed protein product [Fusarium fujikuroi]VZI11465.1 unnamed protein product [Fusarium fujikuroi]
MQRFPIPPPTWAAYRQHQEYYDRLYQGLNGSWYNHNTVVPGFVELPADCVPRPPAVNQASSSRAGPDPINPTMHCDKQLGKHCDKACCKLKPKARGRRVTIATASDEENGVVTDTEGNITDSSNPVVKSKMTTKAKGKDKAVQTDDDASADDEESDDEDDDSDDEDDDSDDEDDDSDDEDDSDDDEESDEDSDDDNNKIAKSNHVYGAMYPTHHHPQPDAPWVKGDCALLATIDSKYKRSRWLEMQANFYNVTGQMVPLVCFKARCERVEAEKAERSKTRELEKRMNKVEDWIAKQEREKSAESEDSEDSDNSDE